MPRSPTFFANLQIVFACLEKVGDLNLCFLSFLMPSYLDRGAGQSPAPLSIIFQLSAT